MFDIKTKLEAALNMLTIFQKIQKDLPEVILLTGF